METISYIYIYYFHRLFERQSVVNPLDIDFANITHFLVDTISTRTAWTHDGRFEYMYMYDIWA